MLNCFQAFAQCTLTTPVPAAGAEIATPGAMALDAAGKRLYFTTADCVLSLDLAAGLLQRVAGGPVSGYSGDGGPALSSQLNAPGGLATDAAGNLFISDTGNNAVRLVTPAGKISTLAGGASAGYFGDRGPASTATLNSPRGLATDRAGNLFVADTNNHVVRRVTPASVITTWAGNGTQGYDFDGFFAREAPLNTPIGLATSSGNLYIADSANNRIRLVTAARLITTVAGVGTPGYSGDDGHGAEAEDAELNTPVFVASDSLGLNLYISDSANWCVRQVLPDSTITTVAGGTKGVMGKPAGIAVDTAGNLYIADTTSSRILKLAPRGGLSTIVGK